MSNPPVLWAQDRSHVFVTLEILNVKEQNLDFEARKIHFRGKNDSQEYDFEIELHSDILETQVDWQVRPTGVKITLEKVQRKFWNRLTQNKQNNVKIDWQKWVNEDESEDSDEQDEMLQNFNDFKKTLPSDLLEKDFSEILPHDNSDEITDDALSEDEDTDMSEDDGFEANGEDTSLYEENEPIKITESQTELEVEELDIDRLEEDVEEELEIKDESE